ncbi:MAG: phosphate acyltransferase PlsX [Solirubrobacterales bacterium]|nr:phosphate acyltransferase PlsX [Solirubrobacterales bacterium]MCB8970405.1 phosphate acyltransferase PlsX [Thermoleophilales bacterium]MCO5325566.1 phosphate acyltransferase PlsX [Solirubrobacterales bacterium]
MRAPGGERITVAFDALGAEGGPDVVIPGVRAAAEDGIAVRVFGSPSALEPLGSIDGVEVVACEEVIGNDEEPVRAVRGRPGASIVRAAADVAAGDSHALASPGSTGATMTAALFALKRIRSVQRPALAVQLPVPGRESPVLMLDVGANTEARASHLVQFAHLGSAFSESVLGVERPRVALLSIGEEAKKGTQLVVDAHEALAGSSAIDFAGNVEGRDLLEVEGEVDVVVTDGFTGNVVLKTIEGTAGAVGSAVGRAARSNPMAMAGGLLLKPALGSLRSSIDPDGTGGAILLGLRGVAVVGHGSSGPEGVANQIRVAARAVAERAVERTEELIKRSGVGRAEQRRSAAAPTVADETAVDAGSGGEPEAGS